jgi:hypothetical protein
MYLLIFGILIILTFLYFSTPHVTTPSHILIIRHANKNPSHNALDSQPLNDEGKARAQGYIKSLKDYALQTYGNNFASAYAITPSPTYSMRPEQTVMPFCFENSIPLYLPSTLESPHGGDMFINFINAINNNSDNKDKPVLICFEHTCIQSLMRALGFSDFDHYWDNDNFCCGIDIDVARNTYKLVYFPFASGDTQAYNQFKSHRDFQECK